MSGRLWPDVCGRCALRSGRWVRRRIVPAETWHSWSLAPRWMPPPTIWSSGCLAPWRSGSRRSRCYVAGSLEVATMHLDPDFREFVGSFNAHEVRYLVVGGYALAAHGLPRATGQFDAWVWVGGDNAERVLAALTAFGFGALGPRGRRLRSPGLDCAARVSAYRIDILTSIDGVEFDDAWSHRLSIEVGCLPLELIGRDDLVRNKVGANRRQDRVDVADLTQEDPHRLTTSGRRTAAGQAGGWRARAGSGAPAVTPRAILSCITRRGLGPATGRCVSRSVASVPRP